MCAGAGSGNLPPLGAVSGARDSRSGRAARAEQRRGQPGASPGPGPGPGLGLAAGRGAGHGRGTRKAGHGNVGRERGGSGAAPVALPGSCGGRGASLTGELP